MTAIVVSFLIEMAKAMFFRIGWKAVAERLFTRLVFKGLDKLEAMSSNDLASDTVRDIKNSLKGRRLKVADDE